MFAYLSLDSLFSHFSLSGFVLAVFCSSLVLGFLCGMAATIAVQALIVLWVDRFNAKQLAAVLAGLGLIPAGLVGLATGLVVRRIVAHFLPGSHGKNNRRKHIVDQQSETPTQSHRKAFVTGR